MQMERGTKSAKLHRMKMRRKIGIGAHRPSRQTISGLGAGTVVSNQAHASNQRGIALHAALLLPPVIVLNHSKSNPLLQLSPSALPLIPP